MNRQACIVGEPTGWHARQLASLLDRRGFHASIVRWQNLTAEVGPTGERIGPPALANARVVVVRGMPGTSPADSRLEEVIVRMDILGRVAATGTPVVNPPKALEIAIDKYLSLAVLASHRLPVPRTMIAQDLVEATRAWEAFGGDCVAKPLFGSRGRGVVRCQTAAAVAAALSAGGGVGYLQEFVPHGGTDIRALVVGQQVFAMARHAAPGHWITNLARGGKATAIELKEEQSQLAQMAASAVGATLAGVDLVQAPDGGVFVLEVNAVPGWRGIERVLGNAVGAAIADHVASLASR